MGDFIGHLGSGLFVLCLALWWTYNGYANFIKSRLTGRKYEIQYSYTTTFLGRELPIEQFLKLSFTLTLLIGEVCLSKFNYWNEKGEVIGAHSIMHVSYYLIFVVHCAVDFLMKCGVKGFPDHMDFFSASLAFFWNALSLYYHVQMREKEGMEFAIHVMPTYFIYLTAISLLLSTFMQSYYILDLLRCYGLIVMGTWFFNVAFILYKPGGAGANIPAGWDMHRPDNISFTHALLGFHISMAVVIQAVAHQIIYRLITRQFKGREYHKIEKFHEESENTELEKTSLFPTV